MPHKGGIHRLEFLVGQPSRLPGGWAIMSIGMQPMQDLLQLLPGVAGVDQEAMGHSMLLEPGDVPGEHYASLPNCFSALRHGHDVKPVAA